MIDISKFPSNIGVILLLIERSGIIERSDLLNQSPFEDRTLKNLLEKIPNILIKTKEINGDNVKIKFEIRPQIGAEHPQIGAERPQIGAEHPQIGAERPQTGAEHPEIPPQVNFPKIKCNELNKERDLEDGNHRKRNAAGGIGAADTTIKSASVDSGKLASAEIGTDAAVSLSQPQPAQARGNGSPQPLVPLKRRQAASKPIPVRTEPVTPPETEFVAGTIFVPGEPYTAAFYNMLDEIGLRQTREPGLPLMQTSGYESFKQYAAETHRLFTSKRFSCGTKPVFDDVIHRIAFIFSLGLPCRSSKDDLWKIFNESKNEVRGTRQKVWTPILGRIRQDFLDNGFGWRNHLLPLYATWETEVKFSSAHGFAPRPELFPSYHADVQAHLAKVDGEAAAEPRPVQNTEGAIIPMAREQIERGEIPNDFIRKSLRNIAGDAADRNASTAAELLERIRQPEPVSQKSAPAEPAKRTASSNAPKFSGLMLPKSLEAVKRNKIAASKGVVSVGEVVRGMAAAVSMLPQPEPVSPPEGSGRVKSGKYANAPHFSKYLDKNPIADRKKREQQVGMEPHSARGDTAVAIASVPLACGLPAEQTVNKPQNTKNTFTFSGKEYRYDILSTEEFTVIFNEYRQNQEELTKAVQRAVIKKTNSAR